MNITAAEPKHFKLRLEDSGDVINLIVNTPDDDEIVIAYIAAEGVFIPLVNEEWELSKLKDSGLQFDEEGALETA